MRCDVAILGGGPAGTAAALSLRQLRPAVRVALAEASQYTEWRAGETLAPGCKQILESLNCWERFSEQGFIESFGTRSVWGSEQAYENEFVFSARGNGWHVDRRRFDAMLFDLAQERGTEVLSRARLADAERMSEGGWKLTLQQNEAKKVELEAAFVVDATGRSASLAARQGAKRIAEDHLMGAFAVFRVSAEARDSYTQVEAQPDGWWYSCLLPESFMTVAWMSDADLIREQGLADPQRWMEHLERARFTMARVAGAALETGPVVVAAQTQRLSQVAGEGWVAAGDAACAFDPLSSQGIAKALRSGKVASFVALDWLDGRRESLGRYERMVGEEYKEYLVARADYYALERRWAGSRFWLRRG